jgi:hypothetical protein
VTLSDVGPFVLIVDDEVEQMQGFAELVRDQDVDAVAVHPRDVDRTLLDRASAVLVDQFLKDWTDQPAEPLASNVPDGISLAAVLRSHLEATGDPAGGHPRTAAFAIRTGQLDVLGAHLPANARSHLLAAQRDIEWVFDKAEQFIPGRPSAAARVAELARAASVLPRDWHDVGAGIETDWLALPAEASWADTARWQIEQCRPPRHVVATSTAGRAWLRWFLQRILPFPTFLLDDRRAALAVGLDEDAFLEVADSGSPLTTELVGARYTGACASFLGRRWWRAGLAALVADVLERSGLDSANGYPDEADLLAALGALHGAELLGTGSDRGVLRVDADYATLPGPVQIVAAARLQPDGWPPYADDAWAARDELTSAEIRHLVVLDDRWQLPDGGQEDVQ